MADMAARFTWNVTTNNELQTISASIEAARKCFKILHTWQSENILEFPWKNSSSPSKTVDLCLEMSSDFNYDFSFVVEKIFKIGNTTKSQCLGVHIEAQAHGKEIWINITCRPTSNR